MHAGLDYQGHVKDFPAYGISPDYCDDPKNKVDWKKENDRPGFEIPGTHFGNDKYIG